MTDETQQKVFVRPPLTPHSPKLCSLKVTFLFCCVQLVCYFFPFGPSLSLSSLSLRRHTHGHNSNGVIGVVFPPLPSAQHGHSLELRRSWQTLALYEVMNRGYENSDNNKKKTMVNHCKHMKSITFSPLIHTVLCLLPMQHFVSLWL